MGSSKSVSQARRTVRREASLEGVGIHTGAKTRVVFQPAPPGTGIAFRRSDLAGQPMIPAKLANVGALERRTALKSGDAEVHTVEHLLAAVSSLEIDDLVVDINGPEPPICDGSFQPFLETLQKAEPADQGGEADEFTVREAFSVVDGESSYLVGPAPRLMLSTTIDFPHPIIGRQSASFEISDGTFASQLARARTFGFVHEV